jgi:hypothetical protein
MDKFESLPYRSRKRDRDDAFDSALFLFPRPKRANHNEDRPQSNANPSSPQTESAEAMTRSLSPDGGVAIDEEGVVVDEEALASLRDYRHVALSDDDDSSDDCSSDEGSLDDDPPRGRLTEPNQVVEPLQRCTDDLRRQTPRQSGSSHRHNTSNNDQRAILPYASPSPMSNQQRGNSAVGSDSSMLAYQTSSGLQSSQPLPTVMLNPRVGMVVEGGKLYLAQTLHHYYRKHIHCPHHGSTNGRPGRHRTARKDRETGQVYRVWYCTSQPKEEGHRIDNTAYIELAREQLDQALFDRVLHELIRPLHAITCRSLTISITLPFCHTSAAKVLTCFNVL